MEIEKAYFTLPEILDRWSISEADLIYLAENDKLRLSVRVFGVPLELGDYEETHEGEHFRVPTEQSRFSENAMRYQATLTFLNSRIKGIKTALKGE